jgi:hypothetical protein
VVQWAILMSECGSGRFYCQSVVVGDFTVRAGYRGRYYCQNVVQWAILLSERGAVGDIIFRV